MKYLALLRGINVGGNNLIKKDELKKCFERAGCESVLTYIQSGNILFISDKKNKESMAAAIQKELKKKLGKEIQIVIFGENDYKKILKSAHKSWGKNPDQKHNALFIIENKPIKEIIKLFPEINPKYEKISFDQGVIFWSGSKEHYTKTAYVKKLVKSPVYKLVTIRNSNTSHKFVTLFDKIEQA